MMDEVMYTALLLHSIARAPEVSKERLTRVRVDAILIRRRQSKTFPEEMFEKVS